MRAGLLTSAAAVCVITAAGQQGSDEPRRFLATAYSDPGINRQGTEARPGTAAADRSVLPLGTLIEVSEAGSYSGIYEITDTGEKVEGRHIDLFIADEDEARRFGRKMVLVRVLKWGDDKVLPASGDTDAR